MLQRDLAHRLEQTSQLAETVRWADVARDMTSYNIANAETVAFKKTVPVFGENGGLLCRRSFAPGELKLTGARMYFAIDGPGFFEVQLPDGSRAYTRAGLFATAANGQIVTARGFPLVDLPPLPGGMTTLSVASDGTVSCVAADGVTNFRFPLVIFAVPEGLDVNAEGLFVATVASGNPEPVRPNDGRGGSLRQGYLELSNVQLTEEMARLATLQTWKRSLMKALELRSNDEFLPRTPIP